ncbi:hypothetical protein TPL01_21270 [Sulfuriferula plumbiphila]|uniref:Copper chaperone PCu(A)C n=1 Tax=Sulfuriferula plumbiphila TaxID=171865 RepID=A0A512L934_9PROT|nr:copper chaperone PCu(A)C [Sulfuriferula plumbiphila]BBP04394.1 hypothetical protein SFPGR_18160 [Sulfuriferula plumbiphila]GEP30989.1 hypothetical protein TPL01_21270 [Sulfuriferula plumbiphila]
MTESKLTLTTKLAGNRRMPSLGLLTAAIIALSACSLALAAPQAIVTNARIRLLPVDLPLAGYFDLMNRGDQALILLGASSPAFNMTHMHRSMEHGGTSTMVSVERLEIKPGAALHFSPGGYHLMLMHAIKPLKVGEKVPVVLKFTGGQSLQVMFVVNSAGTE